MEKLTKSEMLWIRACLSYKPNQRIPSVYRRTHLLTEMQTADACGILTTLLFKIFKDDIPKAVYTSIISNTSPMGNFRMMEDPKNFDTMREAQAHYWECHLEALIDVFRHHLDSDRLIEMGYIKPLRFRVDKKVTNAA